MIHKVGILEFFYRATESLFEFSDTANWLVTRDGSTRILDIASIRPSKLSDSSTRIIRSMLSGKGCFNRIAVSSTTIWINDTPCNNAGIIIRLVILKMQYDEYTGCIVISSYEYMSYLTSFQGYSHFRVSVIRNFSYARRRSSKWLYPVCIVRHARGIFWKDCEILRYDDCKLTYEPRVAISRTFYEDKTGHRFVWTFFIALAPAVRSWSAYTLYSTTNVNLISFVSFMNLYVKKSHRDSFLVGSMYL